MPYGARTFLPGFPERPSDLLYWNIPLYAGFVKSLLWWCEVLEGSPQAFFQADPTIEAEQRSSKRNVGDGPADVSRPWRCINSCYIATGYGSKRSEELVQACLDATSNVDYLPYGIFSLAGGHIHSCYILDIYEIPCLLSIAVDGGAGSGCDRINKFWDDGGIRGVRSLTWAEDVEVPEHYSRQIVKAIEYSTVILRRELSDGIRR